MNTNELIPWFLLLNPLISAVLILVALRKSGSSAAGVSTLSSLFGITASLTLFFTKGDIFLSVNWIHFGDGLLNINLGVQVDHLSKLMLLVVTGIGFLVHLYSTVYMEHDAAKARFFGHLSLFMFSMLGIVLADNLAMMFIFWELVGVSSYLLIGHWFTRDSAGKAANKAFLMNRIGDFGFMLGILMIWTSVGTLSFTGIQNAAQTLASSPEFLTVAVLLIFCGAIGKSAQFPLHTWLPDAMEGPTPVSALIHAATMVAAGVFMLARISFMIGLSPVASYVIAWIGAITSLLAALMAVQQNDIKRILAYSTLSQLGYMVMAIGIAPDAHGGPAMFHLFTHAFFKALLFLGAGAIIHALHHEQDIWKMGGLMGKMRKTAITFTLGTLALTGCPGFAGFFSKDAILIAAHGKDPVLFTIGLITAFLTAFYMTRLFVVVFLGKPRSEAASHGHDGPARMTAPLIILAALSVCAGWTTESYFVSTHGAAHPPMPVILAITVFVAGTLMGWALYRGKENDPLNLGILREKFYLDEIYGAIVTGTQDVLAYMAGKIDLAIGAFTRAGAYAAWGIGFCLRGLQFGNLQGYSFIFGLGVIAVIYLLIFR